MCFSSPLLSRHVSPREPLMDSKTCTGRKLKRGEFPKYKLWSTLILRSRRGGNRNGDTEDNSERLCLGGEEGAQSNQANWKSSGAMAISWILSFCLILQVPNLHCQPLLRHPHKWSLHGRPYFLPYTCCLFSRCGIRWGHCFTLQRWQPACLHNHVNTRFFPTLGFSQIHAFLSEKIMLYSFNLSLILLHDFQIIYIKHVT